MYNTETVFKFHTGKFGCSRVITNVLLISIVTIDLKLLLRTLQLVTVGKAQMLIIISAMSTLFQCPAKAMTV